jgi:hypothetical protein
MASRRWMVAPFLVVCAAGLAMAFALWTKAVPGIVHELRGLPEVARVDYSGPMDATLTVVHLRDWHFVPKDLAKLEGLDYPASLDKVERVQSDEITIARFLIRRHDLRVVFSEGLTKETMSGLTVRVDLLRDMDTLASAGKLDAYELRQRRELVLTVGIPGRLLMAKEIREVLPLEDEKALHNAKPVVDSKIVPNEAKIAARRKAMVACLPAEGMAFIVLGGSHDLGPHLPSGTLYVRVTPRSYPE